MFETIASIIKICFIVVCLLLPMAFLLMWAERKESAIMQDRIGANRASVFGIRAWGLISMMADAIKMFVKEDFSPPFANKRLFHFAPFLAMFAVLITFAVIPFGPEWTLLGHTVKLQIADLGVGFLYMFALAPLGIYAIALGAWASNNKYSALGGIRAVGQLISYEVVVGLSLIGLVMVFGTVQLDSIVVQQGDYWFNGWIPKWGVFLQPLGLLLFFPAGFAETKRVPFDLPEGESEIIGFNLEYSGLKFGLFMMSEFIEMVILGALLTTFFFGGWQVPWLFSDGFHFPWGWDFSLPHTAVVLLQVMSFLTKLVFFGWFLQIVRWTLPRFRYDQLIRLCWLYLLPLAVLNVVITGIVILVLQ
ncbi:MAG: NADH-quinone oxidoreductase subunit H [Candidatus Delongbacteria bacterium]|nr:NADH-quinone oxidoreductase subunit H [bacterium]MBL7033766.1 NADH-quinone oxidoreductase subunit H [Candidatus Delongbacteria bacterium]